MLMFAVSVLSARGGRHQFVVQDWPSTDSVRIVLIGDTGQIPVEGDPHKMNQLQREQLRRSLRQEKATAIVDLGDLFYWKAPKCRRFGSKKDLTTIDQHLYDHIGGLETPVFLVLGNHDVGPLSEHFLRSIKGGELGRTSRARERCYLLQPDLHPDVYFPSTVYGVDFGPMRMATLHTSAPYRKWPKDDLALFFDDSDWSLLVGHHVYKTACDKENENIVVPWLNRTHQALDLYANGHAHILQLGQFDGTTAITSGAGSKKRVFPECSPQETNGVLWGASEFGYAVLDVDPNQVTVRFKTIQAEELFCWKQTRGEASGAECTDP